MQVELKSVKGDVLKKITASDYVWREPFNDVLVHQVIVSLQSNKRQGTSNTLRRRDVNYSTAKLRNQKGAGRARVGSRSSHVLGNSVAHGPHPRSYKKKIFVTSYNYILDYVPRFSFKSYVLLFVKFR